MTDPLGEIGTPLKRFLLNSLAPAQLLTEVRAHGVSMIRLAATASIAALMVQQTMSAATWCSSRLRKGARRVA